MNEILQAILDYIDAPQTDYAIVINGPWGCGKTYFWKHVVEPKLRQVQCNGAPCHPLYASFYGCQCTKDIDTQLFLASHPRLAGKWTEALSNVGGPVLQQVLKAFTPFELPAVDLRWLTRWLINKKGAILCFDDLERARLSVTESLGYINAFVEHEGVKTIILANENAIEEKATYGTMKEKVVGASLTFRPELEAVFGTLIDEHRSRQTFYAFLSGNASLIRHLFERSETNNIRSLRRALAALAVIFDALKNGGVDPNAVAKELIYAVAPASFELHGRGTDPAKVKAILNAKNMWIAGASYVLRPIRDDNDEIQYERGFWTRYLADMPLHESKCAVGCPPIFDFLVTGMLDRPKLLTWARELIKPPDESEQRKRLLSFDFIEMKDDEFSQTAAQALTDVETGKFSDIGSYVELYDLYEHFSEAGLITATRQELLQKCESGLERAKEADRLKFDPHLPHAFGDGSGTCQSRQIRQCALRANKDVQAKELGKRTESIATRLDQDASGFIDSLFELGGDSGLLSTPVFQAFPPKKIVDWIVALPNQLKRRFELALSKRYESRDFDATFQIEAPVLQQISKLLKDHCESLSQNGKPLPLSVHAVKVIGATLDRAVQSLSQLKKQGESSVTEPAGAKQSAEQSDDTGSSKPAGDVEPTDEAEEADH